MSQHPVAVSALVGQNLSDGVKSNDSAIGKGLNGHWLCRPGHLIQGHVHSTKVGGIELRGQKLLRHTLFDELSPDFLVVLRLSQNGIDHLTKSVNHLRR